MALLYDAFDYTELLRALLPPGSAWAARPGSTMRAVVASLGRELSRIDVRSSQLVGEAFPNTTTETLVDWERVFGLPDPCVTVPQTLGERQQALTSKVTSTGGASARFFINLAAQLGYTITIDEPHSAGEATSLGIPFTGDGWAFTWRVNVPDTTTIRPFLVGHNGAGDPLRSWGDEVIECRLNQLKPAHTILLFAYG